MGVQLLAVEFGGNLSNAYEALDTCRRDWGKKGFAFCHGEKGEGGVKKVPRATPIPIAEASGRTGARVGVFVERGGREADMAVGNKLEIWALPRGLSCPLVDPNTVIHSCHTFFT